LIECLCLLSHPRLPDPGQVRGENFGIRLLVIRRAVGRCRAVPVTEEDVFGAFVDGVLDGDGGWDEEEAGWLQAVLAEPGTQVLGIGGIPLMLPAVAARQDEVSLAEVEADVDRRQGLTHHLVPWMLLP
jgi:hypothetical protein